MRILKTRADNSIGVRLALASVAFARRRGSSDVRRRRRFPFIARQQAQFGVVREAVRDGGLFGTPQELSESRLAGEHEGHDETRVHVEAGEDAQHGQRFGAQVMCLVEQDDAAHAVAGGVFESALQLAHQGGIDAGGREAAGDGDLLAQITLGEAGHLDVLDPEATSGRAATSMRKATVLPVPAGAMSAALMRSCTASLSAAATWA